MASSTSGTFLLRSFDVQTDTWPPARSITPIAFLSRMLTNSRCPRAVEDEALQRRGGDVEDADDLERVERYGADPRGRRVGSARAAADVEQPCHRIERAGVRLRTYRDRSDVRQIAPKHLDHAVLSVRDEQAATDGIERQLVRGGHRPARQQGSGPEVEDVDGVPFLRRSVEPAIRDVGIELVPVAFRHRRHGRDGDEAERRRGGGRGGQRGSAQEEEVERPHEKSFEGFGSASPTFGTPETSRARTRTWLRRGVLQAWTRSIARAKRDRPATCRVQPHQQARALGLRRMLRDRGLPFEPLKAEC